MTNINQDKEEYAKAAVRHLHAEYLKKYIKEPLEQTINPLLKDDGLLLLDPTNPLLLDPTDPVLLLIFTRIDLLGYLYTGDSSSRNSSKNAVQFIRDYFGKIDARYKEVGGLLYYALRHGFVHLSTPKRIQLKNEIILDFSFAPAGKPQYHLSVKEREEIERGEKLVICRLSVDLSQLYQDMLSAMDTYAEDIRHSQALSDTFWKAFEARRKPEKEKEEVLLRKSYIQDSDFAFIRGQISKL